MITHLRGSIRARDCFTKLCENEAATVPSDGGTCLQRIIDVLAGHELARCTFYERAVKSEIVESLISRCREENRTSDTHQELVLIMPA